MWDVDILFVRQGAAATCWHPVLYKWKGFPFCISSCGRFQGWKHIESRWCISCWAWRNFYLWLQVPSQLFKQTCALLLHSSLYFVSVSPPGAGLLSSISRARRRPDTSASLKPRNNEKAWVNQIFHNSPKIRLELDIHVQMWKEIASEKKNKRQTLSLHPSHPPTPPKKKSHPKQTNKQT